ncbi:hypothetical protein [Paenibacillus sp. PL91]|uniref:hypothetical protein n=1 Tax=Paenibacillus sp. PL91 TaxID=2729538 RepID=UPI00165A0A7E|nr:hypothetical protein [Paenibacillus sp. PL91]MBC9199774.1 hypothetical protein [Paenibacillus sp. PL91]
MNVEDFKDKREATKSKRTARYEVLVADVEEHVRHASDIRNDGNSVTGSRPTMDGDESHAVKVWIPESSDEQRQPSVCWLDIVWDVRAEAFPKAEKWTKGRSSAATWRTLVGLE